LHGPSRLLRGIRLAIAAHCRWGAIHSATAHTSGAGGCRSAGLSDTDLRTRLAAIPPIQAKLADALDNLNPRLKSADAGIKQQLAASHYKNIRGNQGKGGNFIMGGGLSKAEATKPWPDDWTLRVPGQ